MTENIVQQSPETERPTSPDHTRRPRFAIMVMILISLLAGMAGGVYGALNLANRPGIQKLFNSAGGNGQAINQSINLNGNSTITDVVQQVSPAVVSIVVSKDIGNQFQLFGSPFFNNQPGQQGSADSPNVQEVAAGSGFFVSADGLIMTNKHVVSDAQAQYTVVTSDGKEYPAKVMTEDPSNDLAIVKVDINNAPFLAFSDSTQLKLGQNVIAIGNSLGEFQNTVTTGVISGLSRKITAGDQTGSEQLEGIIQTDAAINPGNSGGPLLNLAGQVVGINTATAQQGQSVGFAIPSNDIKVALDSFQRSGKIVRPFIGVRYVMITKAIVDSDHLGRDQGALIIHGQTTADLAVMPGSPADKAGLKEGDIILEADGKQVTEDNPLTSVLKNYKPGDKISLKVYSDGQEKTIPLTLGESN